MAAGAAQAMERRIAPEVELEPAVRPADPLWLIAGMGIAAIPGGPPPAAAGLGLDEALRRIGRAALAHLLRNEPAAFSGDAEGVHQMRVALRRLRSGLAVFGKALPAADRRIMTAEITRLNKALAPVRTLDVMLELLPPVRAALPDPALDDLEAALARARRAAHDRLLGHLRSPRHGAALSRLMRSVEGEGGAASAQRLGALLPALIDRRFRAVKKRGRRFRRQTPKARHRLRIAIKKLRYTVELLDGSPASRAFLKELRRLQDGLGYANDIAVADKVLRRLCAGAAPGSRLARAGPLLLDWHRRALAGRERELRHSLSRLKRSPRFWRKEEISRGPPPRSDR